VSGRVLVAYGSKYGSTPEIANAIATTLRVAGLEVDVRRAREVRSLDRYRVVVLGSAVYMARWRRDAMRLLRRRRELGEREVWLFSSGPLGEDKDEPAEQRDRWTKPKRVEQLAAQDMANEHVVFGGRISDDAGFLRKRMAKNIPPSARPARLERDRGLGAEDRGLAARAAARIRDRTRWLR
jgi:menaquinone-dependent protoporphyrinogen oxidase